ncbi:MAG TPA: histidine kinase [Streptomyces sp.]|uniref:histidine kinase n=1 Tax=Streptomyces sp. TaxID=1931 RepID=UPI002C514742|nr:histidine kinase [Streptomyces sp.]HWU12228.1 histidine kinase [Streptomyces sp.]
MIDPLIAITALFGGGFAATAVGLVRQSQTKRTLTAKLGSRTRELADARQVIDDLDAESRHLAQARLPALVDAVARGHRGVQVPGLSLDQLTGTHLDGYHQAVMGLVEEAVSLTQERIGLAARSSVRDVMDETQTFLHRCQIKAMEEMDRYPTDTAFHQSLMDIDHLVTRGLHALQRTRILTGSWPGLQRADCTLREVIESARGRIDAYQRVDYIYELSTGEVWLEGCNVEPVTVALTELLSNATAYSEGQVSVAVQPSQTGYYIFVDDRGLSMNIYQRQEAARLLSQGTVIDFTTLPDTLQLGFPVIGRLAAEYGFSVDVSSPSPYGGVRAVLLVPRALLGRGPTEEEINAERESALHAITGPPISTQPQQAAPTAPGFGPAATVRHSPDVPDLPQRRRLSRRETPSPPPASEETPLDDPEAFSRGLADLGPAMRESEFPPPTEGEHRHG